MFRVQIRLKHLSECYWRQRAFTLVELLIVVLLVSVIAGFGIPNFSKTTQTAEIRNMRSDFVLFEKVLKNYYINTGDADDFIKSICPNSGSMRALSEADLDALNRRIYANYNQTQYVIECREQPARSVYMQFRYSGSVVSGNAMITIVTDANDNVLRWMPGCTVGMDCPYDFVMF